MRRPGTRRWAAAPTGAHRPPSPSTWTLLLPRKCPAAAGACLGEFEAGESMKVMPVACRCFTEIEALVERSASARFTVAMVSFLSLALCALRGAEESQGQATFLQTTCNGGAGDGDNEGSEPPGGL